MAISKRSRSSDGTQRGRSAHRPQGVPVFRIVLVVLIALGALAFAYRTPMRDYALAGTSYSARMICSCRFLSGRSEGQCESQFDEGSDWVFISADEQRRSVTAYIPLLASQTANYRDGYGCVLEAWED